MDQGMDPGEINAMRKAKKVEYFGVWEDNWEIVQMFLRLQTQWRMSMSGVIGLDYASLDWLCRLYSVKDPVNLFEGLQVMEHTALSCFSKKN